MPIYEYYCPMCEKKFEALVSLRSAENGWQPACPQCGGDGVIRVFSRVAVRAAGSFSGGCPPSAGPGCCG